MARTGVTFEAVEAVCIKLSIDGTKPNQRNVRSELGTGSTSTILRHIQKWEENKTVSNAEFELPVSLVNVLKNTINSALESNSMELKGQLEEKKLKIEEAILLIELSEKTALEEQDKFNKYKVQMEEGALLLEKKLSASTSRSEDLKSANELLIKNAQESKKAEELLIAKNARIMAQLENQESSINRMENQVLSLSTEISEKNKALMLSEKNSASFEAKSSEQEKYVQRIEKELKEGVKASESIQKKHDILSKRFEETSKFEPILNEQTKYIKRLENEANSSKETISTLLTKNEKLTASLLALPKED